MGRNPGEIRYNNHVQWQLKFSLHCSFVAEHDELIGRVAERSIATVLKTVSFWGPVSSNLTPSATFLPTYLCLLDLQWL
jgi:hypothetical protein